MHITLRPLLSVSFAALMLSGCFATQQDIRVLQGDLMLMRAEAIAADSARRMQLLRVENAVTQLQELSKLNDSLKMLTSLFSRFRSDVAGSMGSIEQQLLQIQELTGQSQRGLREVRASLEERQGQVPPPAGAPPGEMVAPGPAELYRVAREQYNQGSHAAARIAFQDLVDKYPKDEVVPHAQYYIAQTFADEGKTAEADSVYALVVAKYPKAPVAPMALFKRGTLAQTAGKTAAAKKLLTEVIKKYPRSDEASLARDRIDSLDRDD